MGTWGNFFIIFSVVLALFGMIEWLLRWFGADRLASAARRHQPRLAVIDSARIDRRRTLVLIRRDNVEQLVMIGGPNDVVIEQNVLRAIAAPDRAQRAGPAPAVRAIEFSNELTSAEVLPRPQPMPSRLPSTRKPAPPLEPHPPPQSVHDVGELRETLKALLHDFDEHGLDTKPKPTSEPELQPLAKSEAEIGSELIEPKSVEEKWTEPNLEPKQEPEQQAESQPESELTKPAAKTEPKLVEPDLLSTELSPEPELEQQAESKSQPKNEPKTPGP